MKPKQLTLVVILALVLGGAGYLVSRRDAARFEHEGSGLGNKVLPEFPLNDVTKVVIQDPTNILQLAKHDEQWTVVERYGYPADFSKIRDLLRDVWELKVVQQEEVGPSVYGRLELKEPGDEVTGAGTLISFNGEGDTTLSSLLLGKQHMRQSTGNSPMGMGGGEYPDGRYVRVPGSEAPVALVSETFSSVQTQPSQWIDKRAESFFKVEGLKSVEVTHPEATNSWKIYRETEGGELLLADAAEGEELDTGKASGVGNLLSWPNFNDVADPNVTDEDLGMDVPIVAKLETFKGFAYTVTVGSKAATNDNRYLRVSVAGGFAREREAGEEEADEDKERLDKEFQDSLKELEEKLAGEKQLENWTYLVSKYTVDNILKGRAEFLKEPEEEEMEEPAAATESEAGALGAPPAVLPDYLQVPPAPTGAGQ